jgi:hypothetical protein
MPPKRPTRLKFSIAKLRGVERERAAHVEELVSERDYGREPAQLVAYVSFPLDDDVSTSAAFAAEIASLSMDVAAFAESAGPGASVHAAVMALHAYRAAAEAHGESAYLDRFDRAIADAALVEQRFGD